MAHVAGKLSVSDLIVTQVHDISTNVGCICITCGMAIGARQAIPEVFQKGLIYWYFQS